MEGSRKLKTVSGIAVSESCSAFQDQYCEDLSSIRGLAIRKRRRTRSTCESLHDRTPPLSPSALLENKLSVEDSPTKKARLLEQMRKMRELHSQQNGSTSLEISENAIGQSTRQRKRCRHKSTSDETTTVVKNEGNPVVYSQKPYEIEKALEDAKDWQCINEPSLIEEDPIPPCLIYGAPFLFRFLLKFPQILAESDVPESRTKVILKHLSLFLEKFVVSQDYLFNVNVFV